MPGLKMFSFFATIFVLGSIIGGISEGVAGIGVTKLSANINDAVTTIQVDSTVGFPGATHPASQRHIVIGREVIHYTDKTDTSFTGVTRGAIHPRDLTGSRATSHSSGDMVMNATASAINNLMGILQAGAASPIGTVWALATSDVFWRAFWQMLMWDYAFFEGQLAIVRILFMTVFSGGLLFGIAMLMVGLARGIFAG